ncbi:hypothetical protein E2X15_13120 [Salmonella enterica]|nr:hypothetical protein [Salmonella enterica]EAT5308820.1 hypothetical protein [Salmonella enterica subsp. arizonae serovar 13,23:gz51:-]EAO1747595.1 hypothetical protein [Salmonella enterica]EAQ0467893.1 hypothetical protein [Salmonella enterica]EAQ1567334.1 hypothetical protein [Salmonella enterica]
MIQADRPYRKLGDLPDYRVRSLRFFAFKVNRKVCKTPYPVFFPTITSAIYHYSKLYPVLTVQAHPVISLPDTTPAADDKHLLH